MKPGFALILSTEGIVLLHRAIRGWLVVGEVPLDAPNLGAALAHLRRTAQGLAPQGLATKLVLPEDQVLYTTVSAPGRSLSQRRAQVSAALDGRTPYRLEEIVYDIAGDGPELQVAAVARETLAEAEAFADEHGFNAVCFVAAPGPELFAGEPWFGETRAAARVLPAGESVTRDSAPVTIVGQAVLPRSATNTAETEAPKEAAEKAPGPVPTGAVKADSGSAPAANPRVSAATDKPSDATGKDAAKSTGQAEKIAAKLSEAPALATAQALAPEGKDADTAATLTDEGGKADREAPKAAAFALSFSSRRRPGTAPSSDEDEDTASRRGKPPTRRRGVRLTAPTLSTRREGRLTPLLPGLDARAKAALETLTPDDIEPEKLSPAAPEADITAKSGAERPDKPGKAAAKDKAKASPDGPAAQPAKDPAKAAASATGPSAMPPRVSLKPPVPKAPDAVERPAALGRPEPIFATGAGAALDKADAQTLFGTGGARPQVRGGRIVALVLALALVVLIGLAGLWSWIVLSEKDSAPAPVQTAALSPSKPTPAPAIVEPAPLPKLATTPKPPSQAAPEAGTAPAASAPAPAETASAPAASQPDNATVAAVPAPPANSAPPEGVPQLPSDPVTRLVPATVRVQEAPKPGQPPAPTTRGTIALPDLAAARLAETAPPAPARPVAQGVAFRPPVDPPAYGTVFDLGPDGLVKPTPEGALNPDGALIIAGRPPVVPPPRPGSAPEASAPEAAAPGAATPDATAPDAASQPNPALAAVRPKARPEGLTPPAPAAPDPMAPEPSASDPNASRLAVAVSPMPQSRPNDFSQLVATAIAAAQAAPPAPSTSSDAQDNEPEPIASAPALPTSASVAKQATLKNAIRLNQLSLIGVFGAPSSRQALLRTASGRIVKVKVGDRIDGGKVAAIGQHELHFIKNGRNIVLAMPDG